MNTETSIHLTENLNRLLEKDRRSLSSIAKELGINKSTIHNWQNGVLPQSLVALIKIAAYFEVPISDLIFEKNRTSILHQISVEERYEIIVRRIEPKKGKGDD
jgi:transcriptional regulator with XRE-family HTH domain